jgi:hypothetical protein
VGRGDDDTHPDIEVKNLDAAEAGIEKNGDLK